MSNTPKKIHAPPVSLNKMTFEEAVAKLLKHKPSKEKKAEKLKYSNPTKAKS